jgi:branched-chain amino acid transport system substrate-binding protein
MVWGLSAREDAGILIWTGRSKTTLKVTPVRPVFDLPGGVRFAADFRRRLHRPPGPYAAYGYEAMRLALDAIARADRGAETFRPEIAEALLDSTERSSVLGKYSITADGDTTLQAVAITPLTSAQQGP